MAQYTHQKHSCMVFAFGIIKIDLHTSRYSRSHLHLPLCSFASSIAALALDDKDIFFISLPSIRPSFDLNILDGAEENGFLYPHYLCTDTQSVCMLMIYFMATLVWSHVLSSSEYSKTRFLFVDSMRRFMRNGK